MLNSELIEKERKKLFRSYIFTPIIVSFIFFIILCFPFFCLFFIVNNSNQNSPEYYFNFETLLEIIKIILFFIAMYFFYLILSYDYYNKVYNANLKRIALNLLLKNILKNSNINIDFYIPRRRYGRKLYFGFDFFPDFYISTRYYIKINNIEISYIEGSKYLGSSGLLFIIPKNVYNYNYISYPKPEILHQDNEYIYLFFSREYYTFFLNFTSKINQEKINIILKEAQFVVNILLSFVKFY